MKTAHTILPALLCSFLLSACNTSSQGDQSGAISLYVTDAPIDNAESVVVQFSSITLKAAGKDDVYFEFKPAKSIDLLKLQGMASQSLLQDEKIPEGKYNEVILGISAEFDGVMDTYITTDTGSSFEMRVPSGSKNGLRLNKSFSVAAAKQGVNIADDDAIYTIDFDLRKSVVKPHGELNPFGHPAYFLKPVLRFVKNIDTGSVKGAVAADLLTGEHCSDEDPNTYNAVYAFEGPNVVVDDYDNLDAEPISSAIVKSNGYELGFLNEGRYTLAFTCASDLDVENEDNPIVFVSTVNVEIEAGEVTEHHFSL